MVRKKQFTSIPETRQAIKALEEYQAIKASEEYEALEKSELLGFPLNEQMDSALP